MKQKIVFSKEIIDFKKDLINFISENYGFIDFDIELSIKTKNNLSESNRIIIYFSNILNKIDVWKNTLEFICLKLKISFFNLNEYIDDFNYINKHGFAYDFENKKIKYYLFLHDENKKKIKKCFDNFLINQHINKINLNYNNVRIIGFDFLKNSNGILSDYIKLYFLEKTEKYFNSLNLKEKKKFKNLLSNIFKNTIKNWLYIMIKFTNSKNISKAVHIKFSKNYNNYFFKNTNFLSFSIPSYIGFYYDSNEINFYFLLKTNKIALVTPPTFSNYFFPLPPLSLASLSGFLKEKNFFVDTIDLDAIFWLFCLKNNCFNLINNLFKFSNFLLNKKTNKYLIFLNKLFINLSNLNKYNVVCFSIMGINTLISALFISRYLKKNYNTKIIFGGVYTKPFFKFLNKFKFIDYIFVGRCENEFFNLINNNFNIKEKIIFGNLVLEDFSIDFSRFNLNIYKKAINNYIGKELLILPYELSIGCLNKCSFCGPCKYSKFYHKSFSHVVDEIKILSKKYSSNFFFYDSSINLDKVFFKNFLLNVKNKNIKFSCYAFPTISKNDAILLKNAGCINVRIAVETTNKNLSFQLNKPFNNLQMFEDSINNLYNYAGIKPHLLFITKIPNQSLKDIDNDFKFIKKFKSKISAISIYQYTITYGSSDYYKYSNCNLRPKREYNFFIDDFTSKKFNKLIDNKTYNYFLELLSNEKILVLNPEEKDNHLIKYYAKFFYND
jgi:radical SAM superfamily enzyme YgiQ (UPF0313 family)